MTTLLILAQDVLDALGYTPLSQAGGTLTGTLTLAGDPTLALHAATKQYVDTEVLNAAGGGGGALDEGRFLTLLAKQKKRIATLEAQVAALESADGDGASYLPGTVIAEGTVNITPGNIAAQNSYSAFVAAQGAVFGDHVEVTAPGNLSGIILYGYIDAANDFNIRLYNPTASTVAGPSGSYKYRIVRW